jgi:mono/diheme cytochrome c family protein
MKPFHALLNAILALSVAACASTPDTPGNPIQNHMYAHFSEAGKVQTAVIFGDLDGMRSAARNLAEHEEPRGLPEAGLPFLDAMHEISARIAVESSLPDAAVETARLGATCGSCHEATDGGPVFRPNGLSAEDLSQTMVRHIQGADRLWEGLIGPSDLAWRAGADLLASGSVDPGTMATHPGQESMFAEIFRLGRLAQEADDQEKRTQVYGQILSTCSGCHTVPDHL